MTEISQERRIPPFLYFGFAVSSIGGPLALLSIVPGTAGPALASAGLATVLAAFLFLFPLLIWYRYSEHVAAAGGLYAFVEVAAGRRAAQVQAAVWTLSYGLYLAYTVAFIVYDQLPVVFPGIAPYRPALEIGLPLVLVAVVLAPLTGLLALLLATAALQLGLVLVLGTLQLTRLGTPWTSFLPHHGAPTLGRGAANVSLLFICASLPLFLGGEVRGGGRTVRLGLVAAFATVAAYLVFGAFPLSAVPNRILSGTLPGVGIASAYGNRPLAVLVGVVTVASVAGLIVAEFLALGRVLHVALRRPPVHTLVGIGAAFVLADALSLVDPEGFYEKALMPSLGALYVSQLIVFAAYPLFRRRYGRLGPADIALTLAASALMVWGFYDVATGHVAS